MTINAKPTFNTVWAERGDVIVPSDLKIARGWVVEIPPHQQFNWWMKRVDSMLVHINQRGIPQWDATMQYYTGLSYVQAPDGVVYRAIQDSLGRSPVNSPTFWEVAFMRRADAYTKLEIDTFRNTDRTYVDATFLRKASNLSDVPNKADARANLGIYSQAETNGLYLQIAKNLSDIPDTQIARTNLQVYSKAEADTAFARRASNLSDISSATAARANLGLGNSAILNVGTAAGTVAAGNDARIVNAVPNSRQIIAGRGMTGGGALSNNVTVHMNTPRTISSATGNVADANGHTHAIDINLLFPIQRGSESGTCTLPNGMILKWGVGPVGGWEGGMGKTAFITPFPTVCTNVIMGTQNMWGDLRADRFAQVISYDRAGVSIYHQATDKGDSPIRGHFLAIGY